MRTVFMGTPEFALPSLRALAASTELVGVFTQPDRPVGRGLETTPTPVKKLALELGVPVFQPERMRDPEAFAQLEALRPDLIVVVAYGQILKSNVLELPRYGCINVHASLLPRWRGAAPIHWALLAGDAVTGVCTQAMVQALDAGDVWVSLETAIAQTDTLASLHDRLATLGAQALAETLPLVMNAQAKPTPQDPAQVTLARKISKEMGVLDLNRPAIELERCIRALNPWPGTWITVGDKDERVFIREARLSTRATPVGILQWDGSRLWLGSGPGESSLELVKVQRPGKAAVDAAQFWNGLRISGDSIKVRR